MDCADARELILESLAEQVEGHVEECAACRSFLESQLQLDVRLCAAIVPPPLPSAFRASVMRRVGREPLRAWPEFLPDAAHLLGCAGAVGVCLWTLPYAAGPILTGGAGFTVATYFLQCVVRSSWEALEEIG